MDRTNCLGESVAMQASLGRCALVILIYFSHGVVVSTRAQDTVHNVQGNDVEMQTAIKLARDSLPQFWAKLQNPSFNEEDFCLKVAMPSDGEVVEEHIWVKHPRREQEKIHATIDNDPKYLQQNRIGQKIEFDESQISDWMYLRDGKIVGNFTLRPLLSRMPAEQAAFYRAKFAEP